MCIDLRCTRRFVFNELHRAWAEHVSICRTGAFAFTSQVHDCGSRDDLTRDAGAINWPSSFRRA